MKTMQLFALAVATLLAISFNSSEAKPFTGKFFYYYICLVIPFPCAYELENQ